MGYIIIIIIILLIINMILTIISITKHANESNITERLGRLEVNTIKELNDFKDKLTKSMNEDYVKLLIN